MQFPTPPLSFEGGFVLTKQEGVEHNESDKIHVTITTETARPAAYSGRTVICLPAKTATVFETRSGEDRRTDPNH